MTTASPGRRSPFAARASVPARTGAELVALARPGGPVANFGSAGNGTVFHLVGELFKKLAGLQVTHVPYRGGAPVVADRPGGAGIDHHQPTLWRAVGVEPGAGAVVA